MRADYTISAKPLDFSFLKLTDIAQLRKEVQRGGNRKKIPESDDEEDMKKNENANPIAQLDASEDRKEQELV